MVHAGLSFIAWVVSRIVGGQLSMEKPHFFIRGGGSAEKIIPRSSESLACPPLPLALEHY